MDKFYILLSCDDHHSRGSMIEIASSIDLEKLQRYAVSFLNDGIRIDHVILKGYPDWMTYKEDLISQLRERNYTDIGIDCQVYIKEYEVSDSIIKL